MSHFKAGDRVVVGSSTIHIVRTEDMGVFFGTLLIGIDTTTGNATSAQGDTAVHASQDCEWCHPSPVDSPR